MSTVHQLDAERAPLAFALRYAQLLGWAVLPLAPGAKKPAGWLVPNGFHDATTDPATIREWWTQCPDAGVGIACKASGLVVIDIDPRNGGMATIEALEAQHGPMASDVLAYTGGGGEHRVFAAGLVENLPGKLGPGVDVKADGYIAVEPTLHPSGRVYGWEASSDPLQGAVPSTLPGWVRDMARTVPAVVPAPEIAHQIDPRRAADAAAALAHIDGDDRDTWLRVGMAIHNEAPTAEGYALWESWSQRSAKFDPQDQLRVWRSFKRRGLSGVGLNTVFAMAQSAGWLNRGGNVLELPAPADGLLLDVHQLEARSAATRWAVKGMVPESAVGMIFGASGTFKSFIALDYALHRAWGLAWCGQRTRQAVPVFVAAEGGAGLIRRIKAWHLARGIDWRQCPMRVVILPLLLTRQAQALADAIKATGVQPGDIIVDTMSQTFDGNENAADEVAGYLRALQQHLAAVFGCTVIVVHHSGHGATERPRGSSAIMANVDFLFGVFRTGDESMVSTVECLKVKDGERFKPIDFLLSAHRLGVDPEGDEVTSLSAAWVDNVGAILTADAGKKEGHRQMLVRLAGAIGDEREVRKAFDAELSDQPDGTRRAAWKRARDWALQAGTVTLENGRFVVAAGVAQGVA